MKGRNQRSKFDDDRFGLGDVAQDWMLVVAHQIWVVAFRSRLENRWNIAKDATLFARNCP